MSSYNPRLRHLSAVALLCVAMTLSGCGFKPLYGQNATSASTRPDTVSALSAIAVKNIPNRDGQMMRTALERRLNVKGDHSVKYHLVVNLKQSVQKLAVERNAFATRANLSLTATYNLVRISDGLQLTAGKPHTVASYNVLASDFATLSAQADARKRAIENLADDIRARLAIYFAGPGSDQSLISRGGLRQP